MIDTIAPYLLALLPTVGVAFLFYWIIKYMIEADRRERKALAAWRKEHERPGGDVASTSQNAPSVADENSGEKPVG